MATFNPKFSSRIPSEKWFQKQNYETLAKIAELLYRTHKIKLEDNGWSEMTEDLVSERCGEWDIKEGTNMWHSINRLRNANGPPSWEEGHDEEVEDDEDDEEDDEDDEEDDEDDEEEHGDEEDEEEYGDENNSEFSKTLLETWRSAGMRATEIHRYEDNSCDISMKSPFTGATVSARVPHSFLLALNAE